VLAQGYAHDVRVAPVLALAREQSDARRDAVQRTAAQAEAAAPAGTPAHNERVVQETR